MSSGPGNSVLAFDVGGSHISAAICRGRDYGLGPVVSAPHSTTETCDDFLDVLYSIGFRAKVGFGDVVGAVVAMPGPFDYAAGVSRMRHKLPYLYGADLRQGLAERFGWRPDQVSFLNDASAFLLGEIGAGAARGTTRAVGITLGTGIGSAFAVDGRIVTAGPAVPPGGEVWNLPYDGGIVEDTVSTRAIRREYERRTGQIRNVAAIAAQAPDEAGAALVFAEFGHHLGRALQMTLSKFEPQVVVLGGGISRSAHLFLPAAESHLKNVSFHLQVSALLDHAPLVGAAVAWFNPSSAQPAINSLQADAR